MKEKEVVGLADIKAGIFEVTKKKGRETISSFGEELLTLDKGVKLQAIIGDNVIADEVGYNINIVGTNNYLIDNIRIEPEMPMYFSEYGGERIGVFNASGTILLLKHKVGLVYEHIETISTEDIEGTIKAIRLVNLSATLISIMVLNDNGDVYISVPINIGYRNVVGFSRIALDHKGLTEFTINTTKIKSRKKGGISTTVELCYMVKTDDPEVGKLYVSTIKYKISEDELSGKTVIRASKLVEDYEGPYKNIRLF